MRKSKIIALLMPMVWASGLVATDGHGSGEVKMMVEIRGNGFEVQTARLEATFENGMITNLINRQTGELIANSAIADYDIPGGLGALSGDVNAMDKFHIVWGSSELNQHVPLGTPRPNFWHPDERSHFHGSLEKGVVSGEWTGLTNGDRFVEDAILTVYAWEDSESGALCFSASAYFPEGGVYGVQVPVTNINAESTFYMPHFGGMVFDRNMEPGLRPLSGAPFYEAPVVAFETEGGSIGLWTENVHHPYHVYFNWSGRSFSFAFEHNNLTPYESHQGIDSTIWKLDVFTGGGWTNAMDPFRQWYAGEFAEELAIRDSVEWADNIKVVIDRFSHDHSTYKEVLEKFDPETVMFHFWNARAPQFDRELPDWTPAEGYVETVSELKSLGFRTQAYVNTYCINYNSPVFIRDNIADFFLTRKTRKGRYSERPSSQQVDDALIGDAQGGFGLTGSEQFEGVQDGRLLYADPLSPDWREYHVNLMKWWNSTTGTDANYEDTAGTWGDFGNGVVDGKFAGEGAVAMFRELLEGQPHVPMSTEYGPAPVAFGAMWSLVYAQVWGNEVFKQYRLNRQHPVGSFLFGNRAWVPVIRAESDFLIHLITACSDALGGMGQASASGKSLFADSGMLGHMNWRAKVFSQKRLTPYFETGKYEEGLVSMYKDKEGNIYHYYDDGSFQRMVAADGSGIYGRARGVDRVETDMSIRGWPAYAEGEVFAMNPLGHSYAFFPDKGSDTKLALTEIPEGVYIESYREGDGFALLCLGSETIAEGEVAFLVDGHHGELMLNGSMIDIPDTGVVRLQAEFPTSILFSDESTAMVAMGEKIGGEETITSLVDRSGLKVMDMGNIGDLPTGRQQGIPMVRVSSLAGGEHMVDYLIRIPEDATSAMKVLFRNTSSRYGDGTIFKVYVNGTLIKSYDSVKPNPDHVRRTLGIDNPSPRYLYNTDVHQWSIPLGHYAGQNILVSIAVDPKETTNSDAQWYAHPELVSDDSQELSSIIIE